MKYAAATGVLLASLASETVHVARAEEAPLPPVTVYGPTPRAVAPVPSPAPQNTAPKNRKVVTRRPPPRAVAAPAPAPARAVGIRRPPVAGPPAAAGAPVQAGAG